MPSLTTKDFQTLVQEQIAAVQGGSNRGLIDTTVGSILRAVVEAYSAVAMWLQGMILQVLATTRAATSNGADLDSWVADYGVSRLPASAAVGVLTFARFTATQQAILPIGAIAQTADGTQQYVVTADPTNLAYSEALGGYVLGVGISSVNVPAMALNAAAAGNAQAGMVNTMGQAIAGIDTVTNAAAFAGGLDPEADAALRTRFIAYVASLSKATKAAIGYSITSLQQGLSYTLTENQNYSGAAQIGYFYVVVDDGTGYPSGTLLSTVYSAVNAVRPVTVMFGVFPPIVVTANVALTITTAAGYVHSTIVAQVQAAITAAINSLGLGNSLPFTRLAQIAYDASPYVTNVSAVTLNGGTADLTATAQQTIKSGSITVS